MEAHEATWGVVAGETRMDFGWALAKRSWGVARRSGTLLGLGFPATLFLIAAGVAGLVIASPPHHGAVLGLLALLGSTLAGIVFQAALAFAADAAIDGEPLGWREALAEARWRSGPLLGWAAAVAAVGLASALLVHVPRLGFFVSLATIAWSFATVFVVPMIAVDLASPGEALREAPHLLRERWGELMTGAFGIGGIIAVAAIPAGILIGAGASHNHADPGSGTLPILLGALLGVAALGLGVTTFQVFAVALLRDATIGLPGGPAFVERRPKRKSWIVRIGVGALILLLTLGAIGAIVGPRPGASEFHTGFPPRYAQALSVGMPVVYEDRQVGEVRRTETSGSEDVVWFTVEPEYRSLEPSTSITLAIFFGRPCLEIVVPGQAPPYPSSGPLNGPA